MTKPKVRESFEAYFGGQLQSAIVVEWCGNKCFFSNDYYLMWRDSDGFRL